MKTDVIIVSICASVFLVSCSSDNHCECIEMNATYLKEERLNNYESVSNNTLNDPMCQSLANEIAKMSSEEFKAFEAKSKTCDAYNELQKEQQYLIQHLQEELQESIRDSEQRIQELENNL